MSTSTTVGRLRGNGAGRRRHRSQRVPAVPRQGRRRKQHAAEPADARGGPLEAVVVMTDGDIDFPDEEMPYSVLWALTEPFYADSFEPGYGRVIVLPPARD